MKNHTIAEELVSAFGTRTLKEADTRFQIINRLIHEVLSWPAASVSCEQKVHVGYIDYVLRDKANNPALLIEAKKQGVYFTLPTKPAKTDNHIRYVRLRTLATNPNIAKAVNQAAQYCPSIGCQHACVTNGHEFILFRSFIPQKHFLDADAIVIPSLTFFSKCFTQAYNLLGYQAVTAERSLQANLGATRGSSRELYYAKHGIPNYDSPFQKNPYAKYLEPLAKRYFGEIPLEDARMMNRCYVFARETREVQEDIRRRLSDSITPYFQADGAQDISEVRTGGKLSQRIARTLKTRSPGEVLILYGGKGAGKSTFLRRILYFEPPQDFVIHAFPIVVDFLQAPQDAGALTDFIWNAITKALNLDGLLERPMEQLLSLFRDRFAVAERQELAGFVAGSADYLRERNALVHAWKGDRLYAAKRLKTYWEDQGKRAVIAFDNTDQLPPLLQDHCFLSAHSIVRELQCVAVISMREERYCRARTAGVLDAYQNAGFHLAAPDLVGVFTKRLHLVIADLEASTPKDDRDMLPDDAPRQDIKRFFFCCLVQFKAEDNALRRFLQECSRDNTRMALGFFAQFLSSGYTHVEEMVRNPRWTVIEHQVIKPMMIPQRFNYDENKSLVPNLYQCRTSVRGSHFTALRILRTLRRETGVALDKGGYWRVDALTDEFDSKYGMRKDCEAALDVMLRCGLIEANNRLDAYCIEGTGVAGNEMIYADEVRITAFGIYTLDYLAPAFTYLDLVSLDTGLTDEAIYQGFCNAATAERSMAFNRDKEGRLTSRLRRVEEFIRYLKQEEARERDEFLLGGKEEIMDGVEREFLAEKPRVLASARRNLAKSGR